MRLFCYLCVNLFIMSALLFISGQEIFIIVLAVLVLFGSKQIPNLARGLGKGLNEFRKATEDIKQEIKKSSGGISDDIDDLKNTLK